MPAYVRVKPHFSSTLADAVFSNLMVEYKRIAGTCSNTGMAVLVCIHPELTSQEHLFLETLDKNGNADYRTVLEKTHKTYFDQLNAAAADPRFEQLALPLDDQPVQPA